MNGNSGPGSSNPRSRDADDPSRTRESADPDSAGEGTRDHAMPLPASAADERHAAEPIESEESIAGEEDPGAAVDDGAEPHARSASQP